MSVLSTPLKNDFAMQRDIFRFSATLFSETSNENDFSSADAQLQMLKCMFAKSSNKQMSKADIIAGLLEVFKYHISEDEVKKIIWKSRKTFQVATVDGAEVYNLTPESYEQTISLQKRSIEYYIDLFISENQISDAEKCKDAIYKYLYELTTTNINSYKILLAGSQGIHFSDAELSVDLNKLTDDELICIHNFLDWDNAEKNNTLVNVVFTCLEYCLLVNGDSPNSLLKGIHKQRIVYLDTNIIFRGLGINGLSRKKVILAFLSKCRQAKIKLVILSNTKKEFFETVNYYISHINNYARGMCYPGAYEMLSDYNIYAFYEEWHRVHTTSSLEYFRIYLESMYNDFIIDNEIIDDEKIPISINTSHTFGEVRNTYARSIHQKKQENRNAHGWDQEINPNNMHDGTIVRYIEILREQCSEEKDIFLVSSDKVLRSWDMNRSESSYPIIIYPSQLFLVLIKLCGRSDNDYNSFINFINIKPKSLQLTPEKANIIISGISVITEDVKAQQSIVESFYKGEYRKIIQEARTDSELYESVQEVSRHYLEKELSETTLKVNEAHQTITQQQAVISELHTTAEENDRKSKEKDRQNSSEIQKLTTENERKNQNIRKLAEQKTRFGLVMKWYVFPIAIILLWIVFIGFVILQFVACDAKWNFVTDILKWVENTTFGRNVDNEIAAIDSGLFIFLTVVIIPAFWSKPWDEEKRDLDKEKRIEKYIRKHKLD